MTRTIAVAPHSANCRGLTPKELASMQSKHIHGTPAERFWPKVDIRGPAECWPWLAYRQRRGYGLLRVGTGLVLAHRLAWELANGCAVPDGEEIRHVCDNAPCCNPAHLVPGPHAANMRDMVERGRSATGDRSSSRLYPELRRGELQSHAKLTAPQVLAIRARYAVGGVTLGQLGRDYGVTAGAIHGVVFRTTWTHV